MKKRLTILMLWQMLLSACGSQPALVAYSVPSSYQSHQCYVSQLESFIWLEQENQWFSLPETVRQQFERIEMNWLEENILLVSIGQKNSAGYRIELTNWLLEQDHWQVTRIAHQPARDSMQAQMITSPCVLVKIPKAIKSLTLTNDKGQALGYWPY
jgi:hypothetical protein